MDVEADGPRDKTLALLIFEPQNPAWDPTPISLHPPTLTLPQADCPPRGRWRQTERRRVPPFGQTVVWHDAAQLKSTQLRVADMDLCTEDTHLPKKDTQGEEKHTDSQLSRRVHH